MTRQFKPGQLQTGSLYNISSSYAVTASYATNAGVSIDTGSLVTTASFNTFTASYGTGSFTGSFTGTLTGTASYATNAESAAAIDIYSFATDIDSYVLVSNVIGTTGVAVGGDADLRYNSSTNKLTVGSVSATSLTGSLLGTASFASSATNAQDILIYVLNNSGYNIAKGTVVHITASGNSSDIPRIISASYENDANSANTLGIANETITNGNNGFVMTEGVLKGIDTLNFVSGQMIYLGATGSIIGYAPEAPLHAVRLGQVVRSQQNNGSVYVRIDNGYELEELHDVRIITSSLQYGDLLVKSGSVWTNSKQLTGSYGLTGSLTATSFTGSLFGTASYAMLAQTASYVLQSVSASYAPDTTFPYTGSALITGSLGVTGSASILAYTSSAVKIFNVRNSANTYDIISSYGSELTIIGRNESTEPRLLVDRLGSTRMLLGGTTDLNITFPSSGYGQINTGTQGLDVIATSGDIRTRNSSTSTILKGNFFGIGQATPAARLDVRAQGALSTDVAFRVRNSADNDNILTVKGDMSIQLLGSGSGGYLNLSRPAGAGANVRLIHRGTATLPSNFIIGSYGDGGSIGQIILDAFAGDGTTPTFTTQRLISGLSDLSGSALYTGFGSNAATFVMKNALNYVGYGVNPTGTATDHFAMYSADIAAGTASAHFRNEAGHIVKLYTQSPVTSSQGIADALTNLGFLTGSSIINPTASYATNALSASYAPSIPAFPYTGSAEITGSLTVTGSIYTDSIIYSPFTIGLNFETATSYTYKTPYAFKVNSIESDPSGSLTMIYQASGSTEVTSSYIIGDVINKFDKLIITPATASLIVLNSIRI